MGSAAIATMRNDARILLRSPTLLLVQIGMPLVLIAFLRPAFKVALREFGPIPQATGAEQTVPGMAVMFGFMVVFAWTGSAFYREFTWRTWDRLRAGCGDGAAMVAGKLALPVGLGLLHGTVVFGAGILLFDLRIPGSLLAVVVLVAAMMAAFCGLAFLAIAWTTTFTQYSTITTLGGIVHAAMGGAIVPFEVLPTSVTPIRPLFPSYWAMRGFRTVVLEQAGVGDVLAPVGALLAIAALAAMIGVARFRFDEHRRGWA